MSQNEKQASRYIDFELCPTGKGYRSDDAGSNVCDVKKDSTMWAAKVCDINKDSAT